VTREKEREYFQLAAAVLACRLHYAGGRAYGRGYGDLHLYDPVSILIGDLSYGVEMHLLLGEARHERTN
jgi:hypothetical protein